MAEDDDIGLREPATETSGPTLRRAAVVDGCDCTSAELDHETLGQDHAAVVVPENRTDGREPLQSREHRRVGDVARVDDRVGGVEMARQLVDQSAVLAFAQMGVGEEQHVHVPTLSRRIDRPCTLAR